MSIREQDAPDFSQALRGYDRAQVDEYLGWLRTAAAQAEDRAGRAESALEQCRRELASTPTTAGISQRLAAILQLANEEADEIRVRARDESEARTREAAEQATRTIDEANQLRDAIRREIDELTLVREELLRRLIELSGEIVGATERFRGHEPGTVPLPVGTTELYDAEADAPDADDAGSEIDDESPTDADAPVSAR
jgi:cell division septum initiation protein DivIVA